MRVVLNRVRQLLSARLWAWPLVTAVLGAGAAALLGPIEVPREALLARFLWPGDTSAAASMLSFIASAMLTVLTTTISMTLIVLQVASGSFSHQLLRDFISSRAVRGILAVYVGVFSYSILLLRSLDESQQRPPQLAMTIAMLLIFAAVATFIWYLSRVVDMVRVDSIIGASVSRTLANARKASSDQTEQRVPRPDVPDDAARLIAKTFGYVQAVDIGHAAAWAREHGATVVVDVRPGDSVLDGQTMASYWGMSGDDEEDMPELPGIVYLDVERVSGPDYSLGVRQLLDIGVRALSPGVNDPTTALHVVRQTSSLLRTLAAEPIHPAVRMDEEADRLLVWAAVREPREVIGGFVRPMRRHATDPELFVALARLLDVVEEVADDPVRDLVQDERRRLSAAAERELADPDDLAEVLAAIETPTRAQHHLPDGL